MDMGVRQEELIHREENTEGCVTLNINNDEFVGVKELNGILFHLARTHGKEVKLIFNKKIQRINIVFVAGVLLYIKKFGKKILIEGERYNDFKKDRSLSSEIIQYQDQMSKLYFSSQPVSSLDASRQFAPILYIDEKSINYFFEKREATEIDNTSTLFQLLEDLSKKHQSFLRNDIEKLESGKQYLERTEGNIIKWLENQPIIYSFICPLIFFRVKPFEHAKFKRSLRNPSILKDESYEEICQTINSIKTFIDSYVSCLEELAKNIVQHSTERCGIITIRSYKKNEEKDRLVETHVFDIGEKGIVKTIIDETNKLKQNNPYLANDLDEDLVTLNAGFTLNDLFGDNEDNSKILNQQLHREIAHYGLWSFFSTVKKLGGSVAASSYNIDNSKRDTYSSEHNDSNSATSVGIGTSYYFRFPLSAVRTGIKQGEISSKDTEQRGKTGSTSTIINSSTVLQLNVIRTNDLNAQITDSVVCHFFEKNYYLKSREEEFILCKELEKYMGIIGSNSFLAIDFNKVNSLSSSSLLRILAYFSQNIKLPLIVYNVSWRCLNSLININKKYLEIATSTNKNLNFWYKEKSILFYSFLENRDERYYFSDMLYGKSYNDFLSINRIICKTFPNATTICNDDGELQNTVLPLMSSPLSLYFSDNSLKPFDVLLPNGQGEDSEPLFASNLKYVMQKDLIIEKKDKNNNFSNPTDEDKITKYLEKNTPGYMIHETHFRIGSKYHATDFLYGKRLFQNSYYAASIAAWIVRKIIEKKADKTRPITIVGYEYYSSLLVGLTRKYLLDLGYKDVNYLFAIDDGTNLTIHPYIENIEQFVSIVPIASTGSTTTKIKDFINKSKRIKGERKIVNSFQIVSVSDPGEREEKTNETVLVDIITGWWHPDQCPLCFSEDNTQLLPLQTVDKSNLVPLSIFGRPQVKRAKNIYSRIVGEDVVHPEEGYCYYGCEFNNAQYDDSLIYMGRKINSDYRIYSNDTDTFIRDNNKEISTWLESLKKLFGIKPENHIVILAPSHERNITFITLVNEKVFDSSATILFMQPDVDYLENFQIQNSDILYDKNIQFFYVDNDLVTGNTFFNIYDTFSYSSNYGHTLWGAIFLFNYASLDINTRVSNAVNKELHTFISVNFPTLQKNTVRNEIESEAKRYDSLFKNSLHDYFRAKFEKKSKKLKLFGEKTEEKIVQERDDTDKTEEQRLEDEEKHKVQMKRVEEKKNRHARMFKAVHNIYCKFDEINANHEEWEKVRFEDLLKYCRENNNSFSDKYCSDSELVFTVMKVLCQYPFSLYYPLNHKLYEWNMSHLEKLVERAHHFSNNNSFHVYISEFKFHIRRAVILKNSFIIDKKFIGAIAQLLNNVDDAVIGNLPYYLVRQYIILIHENLFYIKNLRGNLYDTVFTSNKGRLFRDLLVNECAVALNGITEIVLRLPICKQDWTKDNFKKEFRKEIIDRLIKENAINKYSTVEDIILKEKPNYYDERYLTYLYIKAIIKELYASKNPMIKNIPLGDETRELFENMKKLLHGKAEEKEEKTKKQVSFPGAFFIVKDYNKNIQVVFDRDEYNDKIIPETQLNDDPFYKKLFEDVDTIYDDTTPLTLLRFRKEESYNWKYEYGDSELCEIIPAYFSYNPKSKQEEYTSKVTYLFIIKISDVTDNLISTEGLAGFYWHDEKNDENKKIKNKDRDIFLQYLLLLRDDLRSFIRHHHQNNEFVQLRMEEERKRYVSLFGHGQLTMENLAKHHTETSEIVSTMRTLQYIIAIKTDAITIKNTKDNDILNYIDQQFPVNDNLNNGNINEFMQEMNSLVDIIYSSEYVEKRIPDDKYDNNTLKDDIISNLEQIDFSKYKYNQYIFKFIIFELIINAKKNRYIVPCCLNHKRYPPYTNDISVIIQEKTDYLGIGVCASSTKIPQSIKDKIKNGQEIKHYEPVAGLSLINTLIRYFDDSNYIEVEDDDNGQDNKEKNWVYHNKIIVWLRKR